MASMHLYMRVFELRMDIKVSECTASLKCFWQSESAIAAGHEGLQKVALANRVRQSPQSIVSSIKSSKGSASADCIW